MTTVLCVALAAVFATAAIGKLRDPAGSRGAIAGFGVTGRAAEVVARLLPPVELAIAAALLVPPLAAFAAFAALALLAVFSAAVARSLHAGHAVACHCFGSAGAHPIGRATLARNGVLAAGAALVALDVSLPSPDPAPFLAGVATGVAFLAPVVLVLLRRHGRLLAELEGPLTVAGHPAPDLGLPGDGRPALVVFTATDCPPCRELAPRLEAWRAEHEAALSVVERDYGRHRAAAGECGVHGTPAAVLVGPDGRLPTEAAHGEAAIAALLATALAGGDGRDDRDDRDVLEVLHVG